MTPPPPAAAPGVAGGRSVWLAVAGWIVSLVCLLLVVVWVPLDETLGALRRGDLALLVLAVVPTIGNLALRGVRWTALLGRRGLADVGVATAIAMSGLALNATVPGKVGEIARVALAVRWLRVRTGEAAMATVVERVIDLAVLTALGFAATAAVERWGGTAPAGADGPFSASALEGLTLSLLAASAAAAALVLAASSERLGRRLRRCAVSRLRGRARRHARRLLLDLGSGARRVRSRRAAVPALVSTLVLWALLAVNVWIVGLAMPGVACPPAAAVAFAVITTLASALPSAPGAWGVYEAAGFFVGSAVVAAESPAALAAFVVASHATQYVPVVVFGLLAWLGLMRRSRLAPVDADARRVGPDREAGA